MAVSDRASMHRFARGLTDDFGIFLHALVVSTERVLETLGQLPQGLVLWLPRHGGDCELRFAVCELGRFAVRGQAVIATSLVCGGGEGAQLSKGSRRRVYVKERKGGGEGRPFRRCALGGLVVRDMVSSSVLALPIAHRRH
jgi:hypothetical protein